MNRIQTTIAAFLIAMAGLAVPADSSAQGSAKKPAAAAPAVPGEKVGPGTQYSEKGADTCLDCHDKDADTLTFSTNGIFKSRHGHRRDKGAPFGPGGMQCEACHGPGHVHSTKGSQEKLTINSQKRDSFVPVAQRNAQCLTCHDSRNRTGWHAAAHEKSGLACADCHQMHTDRDAVMGKTSQPDVCFRCHQKQRADFQKASAHPVKHGLMNCADCHNSHGGSATTASLIKPTLNQTCTSCHADKRGPLLWEHAPVAEDCLTCHNSHGSVRPGLLAKSTPMLCQQCHSASSHPAVARTGASLPGGTGGGAIFTVAGSCTNCHSQVHGSNHPSGSSLTR